MYHEQGGDKSNNSHDKMTDQGASGHIDTPPATDPTDQVTNFETNAITPGHIVNQANVIDAEDRRRVPHASTQCYSEKVFSNRGNKASKQIKLVIEAKRKLDNDK